MNEAVKIQCRRCKGKGLVDSHVVYAGFPGICFSCAGAGQVYKDKFYRAFGVGKKFYGVTWHRWLNQDNPNNGIFKLLATEIPDHVGETRDYRGRVTDLVQCVEITEDQARKFWLRYGENTQLGGVRVGDYDALVSEAA